MKLLRNLLLPFVPIYFLVTWLRNLLYDLGLKTSKSYPFPVVCVGNLTVGGTGKTPMIEYLINLLKEDVSVATLSRGYKRQTKGFLVANDVTSVEMIGDEPFQFYTKFKDSIEVAVCEDRREGISKLHDKFNPDVILLDDAFQHRKVSAKFNILLTSYENLYIDDLMLPTGDLREPKSGAKRAHAIVVTKCPNQLPEVEKALIKKRLKLLPHQELFFSVISYSSIIFSAEEKLELSSLKSNNKICLVTGIANPNSLVEYLQTKTIDFDHLNFPDHYNFNANDIERIDKYELILTTEKDFMRLKSIEKIKQKLYYLPIKVELDRSLVFNNLIMETIKA